MSSKNLKNENKFNNEKKMQILNSSTKKEKSLLKLHVNNVKHFSSNLP